MSWKNMTLRGRLNLVSLAILAAGVAIALPIYLTGEETSDATLEEIQGSKMYLRSLEMYGGKANVLASDFMNWFNALWHGKRLGVTIGCLALFLSALLFLLARRLPQEPPGAKK